MTRLEILLLHLWLENGIVEVYKSKRRIKAFCEPLQNIELFNDLKGELFHDVKDIANYQGSSPEEHKMLVVDLIKTRENLI